MNLAQDRFSKSEITLVNAAQECLQATCYTYETNDDLYDVAVVHGKDQEFKIHRVNMGPWSNLITTLKPIHYAIEDHFKI